MQYMSKKCASNVFKRISNNNSVANIPDIKENILKLSILDPSLPDCLLLLESAIYRSWVAAPSSEAAPCPATLSLTQPGPGVWKNL